jgi:hypothetical protein
MRELLLIRQWTMTLEHDMYSQVSEDNCQVISVQA